MLLKIALGLSAALALLALFWFGYAYPRYLADRVLQVESKAEKIALLIEGMLGSETFDRSALPAAEAERLEALGERAGVLKIKLFDRLGRTLYSTDAADIGVINQHDYFQHVVAAGNRYSRLARSTQYSLEEERYARDVVESYIPIMHHGRFAGAFEIYIDATEDLRQLAHFASALNRDMASVGVLLLGLFLLLVRHNYRAALTEQQVQNRTLAQEVMRRRQIESQLRVNQQRFDHMAHHDTLTGLPNRRLFSDRLEHALALARRDSARIAVLFLDLDRFKTVNDSLGHGTGDRLLVAVSAILAGALRKCDSVARMGGDEFTILLEQVDDQYEVGNLAERLLALLEPPLEIDGHALRATASIGIAIAPEDGTTPEELLKNADTAMYRAKEKGRGCYQFYMPELNARAEARLRLEASIATAIQERQFSVHYQPQVELRSGRTVGAEALLRWQHPLLGAVAPGDFIPIAEETGLIVPIGHWALREACRQASAWCRLLQQDFRVAVNLSAHQFRDPHLFDKVIGALQVTGLAPRCLELELTESLVMEQPEQSAALLKRFHDLGISTSIDDFGTGYSSLSYLRKFPISRLKIDRSFISDIAEPDDAKIVTTIIALAHGLDLEVVAEGIEEVSQLEFLAARGCQLGQGYYFSKPLPAGALTRQMEAAGAAQHWPGNNQPGERPVPA